MSTIQSLAKKLSEVDAAQSSSPKVLEFGRHEITGSSGYPEVDAWIEKLYREESDKVLSGMGKGYDHPDKELAAAEYWADASAAGHIIISPTELDYDELDQLTDGAMGFNAFDPHHKVFDLDGVSQHVYWFISTV